jgi:cell division protein FtsX
MSKLKALLLVILAAVLVDFAIENALPPPDFKLFKFVLGQVPTFALAYICLALGLIVGWTAHVLRIRRKRREAAAAAAVFSVQEKPEPQEGQEGR